MKTWNQMSELERAASIWWDMYKDAHGVRPRGIDTSDWTMEEFQRQLNGLQSIIDGNLEQEKADQVHAIARFENRVQALLDVGTNRERAIARLMEIAGADGDFEYFCFTQGLPYNYFNEVA